MAKLTTPIIPRITTFDPAVDMTVDFLYTGNQINRNRAVVIDTSTCLLYTSPSPRDS